MVKIGYPREFEKIRPLFPQKEKEKDLYISAEDTESGAVLGAIRFFYRADTVYLYETQMPYQGEQSMVVFDGIVRTLLFKMGEEECVKAVVRRQESNLDQYFIEHGFVEQDSELRHDNFPAEFFKPCEGCRGK